MDIDWEQVEDDIRFFEEAYRELYGKEEIPSADTDETSVA